MRLTHKNALVTAAPAYAPVIRRRASVSRKLAGSPRYLFASDKSSFEPGTKLVIDGGYTIR